MTYTLGYNAIGLSLEDTGTTEGLLVQQGYTYNIFLSVNSTTIYWSTGVLLGVLPLLPDVRLGPFDA